MSSLVDQSAFGHFKSEDNLEGKSIMVPEGTVLSGAGTGFRWAVTEFNI